MSKVKMLVVFDVIVFLYITLQHPGKDTTGRHSSASKIRARKKL